MQNVALQTTFARAHAARFHALHRGATPLVLVNAWDAASARVFEEAGAAAIATTSAGIAWSTGYADGEAMPRAELLAAVARICRVVSVPISVDIERGFGRTPADVCETVRALADLGVVGINIEDGVDASGGLVDDDSLRARLVAIADLKARTGIDLFVNARTDVYFAVPTSKARRFDEARRRALVYRAAGADGIFVPGISELVEIRELAMEIDAPLNVYAGIPAMPTADALASAGVRRISVGCAPLQSLLAEARARATTILSGGLGESVTASMLPSQELNALFSRANTSRSGSNAEVSS